MTNKNKSILNINNLAFLVFILVGGFFLWNEHRAHLLGALPYLIFLLCPLMHIFMHKGHGGHGGHDNNHDDHSSHKGGAS